MLDAYIYNIKISKNMIIDLRSDTVTQPSEAMKAFMLSAPLGDDVYGDDPTVNLLEAKVATYFGYESALYCSSGTMTNQIAIKTHTIPGDEIICDVSSHVYNYEGGGIAFNSGAQVRPIWGLNGRITAEQIAEQVHPAIINLPRTALVSLENTLNKAGGTFYTLEQIKPIAQLCKQLNLPLHLDGARIFNALIESKDKAIDYSKYFNSISICFSKGLGAPVGSVLVGDKSFIANARRIRRLFGGGMRQAGVIAAAALYALENNVERLTEDHVRAKAIGKILNEMNYVKELIPIETNIIIFKLVDEMPSEKFLGKLKEHGIIANTMGKQTIRLVTHLDFTDEMLDKVLTTLKGLGLN